MLIGIPYQKKGGVAYGLWLPKLDISCWRYWVPPLKGWNPMQWRVKWHLPFPSFSSWPMILSGLDFRMNPEMQIVLKKQVDLHKHMHNYYIYLRYTDTFKQISFKNHWCVSAFESHHLHVHTSIRYSWTGLIPKPNSSPITKLRSPTLARLGFLDFRQVLSVPGRLEVWVARIWCQIDSQVKH